MKTIYTFENKWHQKYWSLILLIFLFLFPQLLFLTIKDYPNAEIFRNVAFILGIVGHVIILKLTDYYEINSKEEIDEKFK